MNPTLIKEFEEYATKGINANKNFKHTIYRFNNGNGVSVICGTGSYGLEAIEIRFISKGYITHGGPTGYLDEQGLTEYLRKVKETADEE